MMNDYEESNSAIVAMKLPNDVEKSAEEVTERRAEAKGKAVAPTTCRTQNRENVSPGLDRLRKAVREKRNKRYTTLLHHLDVDLLMQAYHWLKRDAAAGVDGITWKVYGADLQTNIADLHNRIHRGAYRAQPSRRRMIPKSDGRERPLGIA